MGFLSKTELSKRSFASLGNNVLISDKSSIYNPENIVIGSNVRIDDFCILSAGEGGIDIGNYVHIACYVSLIGKAKIKLGDYVGISSKSSVYSSSDDYSGSFLVGPMVPDEMKNVDHRSVSLENYSLIGAHCVILPGVVIGEGTGVGALSLVTKSLDPWGMYAGSPLKFIKKRSSTLLQFVPELNSRLI